MPEDITLIDAFARLAQRNAELRDFVRSLLHPEEFGHAVTAEVRGAARRVLNIGVAPATVPEPQPNGGESCSRPPAL